MEGEDLNQSLYDILQKHKITLGKSIRTLEVVYANAQEASLLNIKKGEALLLFTDKHQDEKETIVCIKTSVLYRTIKILSLK